MPLFRPRTRRPATSRPARFSSRIPFLMLLLGLAAPAAAVCAVDLDKGAGTHSRDAALFSASEYHAHVAHLASDALEGRGTGQEGIDKAAEYIADYFRQHGVKPAGDNGTYFQTFTLKLRNRITEETRLAIGTKGRRTRRPLRLKEDYAPLPFSAKGEFKGSVVFAGYGIETDGYNDYWDIDVEDKVVLLLRRGPKFLDVGMDQTVFRAKARKANARDAAAILIVNPVDDEEGDRLFDAEAGPGGRMGMGGSSFGIPLVQIRRHVADEMLQAAGLGSLREVQERIESGRRPASAELKGVTVRGKVDMERVESPVRNIVGMIPGTGPQQDEIIILGGHYDHLGIRNKGQENFNPAKDISNGADDNASGTALVMNMARVYTRGAPPNRSLLLMLYTAEEMGLLGSAHYASHPTVDLKKVVAMLNFDMVGRLKNDNLEVGGMRTGGFEEMVRRVAGPWGLKIKDGGGGRGPSDHTSFYNKNIPVLFFFTGIHRQYHQPEDDTPLINVDGAIRIARFASDIVDEIDARAERPVFKKDTSRARISRQPEDDEPAPADGPAVAAAGPPRPRLGITPDVDDEGDGVRVAGVAGGSPAEKAGVQQGDRILRLGRTRVDDVDDIADALARVRPGDRATLTIRRDDRQQTLTVQFGGGPPGVAAARQRRADRPAAAGPARREAVDRIAELLGEVKSALTDAGREVEVSVKVGPDGDGSVEISIRLSGKPDRAAGAPAARRRADGPAPRPRAGGDHADPHAAADGEDTGETTEMPPVRLGIMPTYGESEGEGYEISGVVEGGPAARAGMKDTDRILQIGTRRITNVYEYMEALRAYKPGDEVSVTVLRDGRRVPLKIKSAAQKSREAA